MSSILKDTERAAVLSIFDSSFDTWCRNIVIYKKPLKNPVLVTPDIQDNMFGFGERQDTALYTYESVVTGVFPAIIKDSDIDSALIQSRATALAPEVLARIIASPISMKVRPDAAAFLDQGETEKVVDPKGQAVYIMNGVGCLQTYLGSEYWVYPLRKTE